MRYKKGINIFARKESITIEGVNGAHYLTDEELLAHEVYPIVEPTYNLETHRLGQLVLNDNKYEFETIAYTAEELQGKSLEAEYQRYVKRKQDGIDAYLRISAELRLLKLAGVIDDATHTVIEVTLEPVRTEIVNGQWISGLQKIVEIGSEIVGVDFYNRLHTQITDYINENY